MEASKNAALWAVWTHGPWFQGPCDLDGGGIWNLGCAIFGCKGGSVPNFSPWGQILWPPVPDRHSPLFCWSCKLGVSVPKIAFIAHLSSNSSIVSLPLTGPMSFLISWYQFLSTFSSREKFRYNWHDLDRNEIIFGRKARSDFSL